MTIWVPVVQGHCNSWKDPELSNAMMLIIIKISFWRVCPNPIGQNYLYLIYVSIYLYVHTHTSLISTIKERRKRKCLVAMIFLNWVNSKHAQSKMKINDYLFFFLPHCFFSRMDGKDLPLNKNKIKMTLSLQSFNFPQIWSKFSEHTQKTAVLHKWKSILLLKARARNICVCFYSMGRSFCIVRSY